MIEKYRKKDFSDEFSRGCSDVKLASVAKEGVAPEGFVSTTNFPTYVKYAGKWILAQHARMDACLVLDKEQDLFFMREMRKLHVGDVVAVNESGQGDEKGKEGVYVDSNPFSTGRKEERERDFSFMNVEVSRERRIDYARIAQQLLGQRDAAGYQIWVVGPAMIHTGAIEDLSWFIREGYVNVLFGGNAVAAHDLEVALLGTSLGVTMRDGCRGDHSSHLRVINVVRRYGSIEAVINEGVVQSGIMYSCVTHKVPFVLQGSIRDDGPLPDTLPDVLEAQDVMREHTKKATSVVMLATALHSIATGNMLPMYYENGDKLSPVVTVCVDSSEFVVNKLKDRGTHQAYGVVTNAQDFVHRIRIELENLGGQEHNASV